MRRTLTLVTLVCAMVLALSAGPAGAAATCTVRATGKHTRVQLLAVRLSSGCATTGTVTGQLRFTQFPAMTGAHAFTLDLATRRLTLSVPPSLWVSAAWQARFTNGTTAVLVLAAPAHQVYATGAATVRGGFSAGGASISWSQDLRVTPTRVDYGSIKISARLPGGRRLILQVHQNRSLCSDTACPARVVRNTETFVFPASFTTASARSSSAFYGGKSFRWLRESPTILLRDGVNGRILGRSDFLAVVRAS